MSEKPQVKILNEPFSQALIVESPHSTLDGHLERMGVTPHRLNEVTTEEQLIQALQQTKAQILFKRSRVPVTRRVVESCPHLHLVQLCCIGDDSIDKVACAEHGVLVCNDPVSNGRSVVELALTHMIGLSRRLYETNTECHLNDWKKNSSHRYEILGKTLGIVGLGNIGRQVAKTCEMLGMNIRFYDNRHVAEEIGQELGWEPCQSLEELFASSDIVTVHTSAKDFMGKDNIQFLDEALPFLGKNRPENSPRIFLNLARGNIHSTDALLQAVESGAIRSAAVDVYPSEPAPGEESNWKNPYEHQPRIVCSPHIGGATMEAQPRIAKRVSLTVENLSKLGILRDCVYAPRATLSVAQQARGRAILIVVHSTARGSKKAIDDAIYKAGVSNLRSAHYDFDIGVAYDLSVLERPLTEKELLGVIEQAEEVTEEAHTIRVVRQLMIPTEGIKIPS